MRRSSPATVGPRVLLRATYADPRADAAFVDRGERVFREEVSSQIVNQEPPLGIVARDAISGLRQVIGAERKELGDLRQLVRDEGGTRHLDHRAATIGNGYFGL